jgi:hypothetical protein
LALEWVGLAKENEFAGRVKSPVLRMIVVKGYREYRVGRFIILAADHGRPQ